MAAEVNADLELDKAIAAADCESVQPSIELVPLNSADKCNESPATIMTTVVDIESVETNYTQIKDVPSLTNIEAGASGSLTASLSKPSSPVAFHEPSAGGMNKKKYGKFRILLDDQQCSETGESGPASESECNSKTPPCQSPTSNAVPPVDSLSTSGKPDQFIPPTLLASNPKLFVNPSNDDDSEEDEEEETENDSTTVRRRGRPPKRRSRATRFTRIKRSNKKDATTPDTNPADESTAFRRRSSRLKSIDDKKDAELETNLPANPVEEPPDSDCVVNLNQTNPSKDDCEGITPIQIKTVTEEEAPTPISTVSVEIELKTSDHTSPLDSATVVETESKEKPKAKRGRKPKNAKVEKGAEKEKPREKRRYTRRKQIESAELDKNVSTAADPTSTDANVPNGFIEPLPLNESSSHDQTVQNCSKNGSDGDESPKPEKVKSRWRRNSELESVVNLPSSQESVLSNLENQANCNVPEAQLSTNPSPPIQFEMEISKENCPMPTFAKIDENIYLIEKKKTKFTKEAKKMVCDCILTKEERNRGIMGCGEDCLNRMLMIECGSRCPLGDHCSNKRFLKVFFGGFT